MKLELDALSPRQIVAELDKYIIGQEKAKKAVAIAIRNRTRRQKLSDDLRDEVAPKNIILIGPTGVGKTEIARRIAKLSGAPFVKVEATKYTEVGYVGRDVESMIRDLMHVGIAMVKQELQEEVRPEAEMRATEVLLDLLLADPRKQSSAGAQATAGMPGMAGAGSGFLGFNLGQFAAGIMQPIQANAAAVVSPASTDATMAADSAAKDAEREAIDQEEVARQARVRERMRKKLLAGELEDKEIEINVSGSGPAIEIFSGSKLEDLDVDLGGLSSLFGGKKKKKKLPIRHARQALIQEELDKLTDTDRVAEIARERVQSMGIIFIDEIDKIANRNHGSGGTDVSREGVQRDILPIVEGCQVSTKFGTVDTRHILFIAAGAFHMSKPSDLIPELQGRFPVRVELESLGADDFFRILTQPQNAITRQYTELIATEGVTLSFREDAIRLIAELAEQVNSRTENIGARRLHTVMELLLEELSFAASEISGQTIEVTPDYVRERLSDVVKDQDLSRYIL